MPGQLTLCFTHPHNNPESSAMYHANIEHFNKQCLIVYEALLRGERLTTAAALLKYQVGDLRRRIKDLKDHHGIDIKCEFVEGTRYKQYYIENNGEVFQANTSCLQHR